MILAASDVSSLSQSLGHWEMAEYICEVFVIFACAGEVVADLATLSERGKKRLERISTMVLVAALAAGLGALIKTNELSGGVIGELGQEAEQAEVKAKSALGLAGSAQASAKGTADEALRAESAADNATTSASSALSLANAGRKEAARLNGELTNSEAKLEAVEGKRAELEKSLVNLAVCNAPRVIPSWTVTRGGITKTALDPLRTFAGRQAIVEFLPDPETRRAALNVAASLDGAGWKIVKITPVDGIEDGVEVQPYFKSPASKSMEESGREWGIHVWASEAADALIDFLHSYNWQARWGWAAPENDIPPGGLKVRIGLYPAVTFVSPPGAKELAAAIAQFNQEAENRRKETENERLKREEEILKHLSPQQALQFKAMIEQRHNEEKLWMERSSGPCQPLTSVR